MKKRAIYVLGLFFVFSSFVFAQTKTVTNADLEKFRQKRLAAEKDLRENYERLGFPSPEELKKQNEQDQQKFYEFSERLRQERIERENAQESDVIYYQENVDRNNLNSSYTGAGFIDYSQYYGTGYYNTYRTRRYRNRGNRRFKRSQDFRQRFINGMPDYVLRNHKFTQINTRRTQSRPIRRRNR